MLMLLGLMHPAVLLQVVYNADLTYRWHPCRLHQYELFQLVSSLPCCDGFFLFFTMSHH
jgi:hypothetical protein